MLVLPPWSLFILSPVWRPGSWQIGRGSPADVKACTISPEEPLNLQDAGVLIKQHLSVLSSWPPGSRGPTGHSWSKRLLVCPDIIENVDQLKCFAASSDSYMFSSLDTLYKYFPMIVCRIEMKFFPPLARSLVPAIGNCRSREQCLSPLAKLSRALAGNCRLPRPRLVWIRKWIKSR